MADHDVVATPSDASGENSEPAVADAQAGLPFIGQWNRLTSSTNWEKGRIICAWREAMLLGEHPVTEYSDEAWAQLVGGVTSQHVGRLRRVYQRFGEVADEYEGLYWSHFQAALDWDDAEMWLEGSVQNGWSVSQMRGQRWQTLGMSPDDQLAETNAWETETESQAAAEEGQAVQPPSATEVAAAERTALASPGGAAAATDKESRTSHEAPPSTDKSAVSDQPSAAPSTQQSRLSVEVESLPDDLAEAFESFKLAIIAHRRENWRETTPESVIECLDALKELAQQEDV